MTSVQVFYVLAGGAAGSLARVLTGEALARSLGAAYPFGTSFVNLLGSFAFGLLYASFEKDGALPPAVRYLVLSGFLGAFTTFSTLMFELVQLLTEGRTGTAMLHALVHGLLGLACVFAGFWCAKLV